MQGTEKQRRAKPANAFPKQDGLEQRDPRSSLNSSRLEHRAQHLSPRPPGRILSRPHGGASAGAKPLYTRGGAVRSSSPQLGGPLPQLTSINYAHPCPSEPLEGPSPKRF